MIEFNNGDWHSRTFGRDILKTRRGFAPIEDVVPNPNQPRQGPKLDPQLKKEIIENGGLFEPLLVEPHPEFADKMRIIDGDRRYSNSIEIVKDLEADGASSDEINRYKNVPIEVTDRTLTDDERFRVWVYIHRQRKEWTRKEKEGVAYSLVEYMDRARAAAVLGISIRELDKTVAVYEMSTKLTGLKDPDSAITWAREITSVSPKYRTPEVESALIRKINAGKLVNSKEVRQLRKIAPDSRALAEFLSDDGSIASATGYLPDHIVGSASPSRPSYGQGIAQDIEAFSLQLGQYSWEELEDLREDANAIAAINEAEARLSRLKNALGKNGSRSKAGQSKKR